MLNQQNSSTPLKPAMSISRDGLVFHNVSFTTAENGSTTRIPMPPGNWDQRGNRVPGPGPKRYMPIAPAPGGAKQANNPGQQQIQLQQHIQQNFQGIQPAPTQQTFQQQPYQPNNNLQFNLQQLQQQTNNLQQLQANTFQQHQQQQFNNNPQQQNPIQQLQQPGFIDQIQTGSLPERETKLKMVMSSLSQVGNVMTCAPLQSYYHSNSASFKLFEQ